MILKFKEFESISGTELVGDMGPNYGSTKLPHRINNKNTDVIYSELYGLIITHDDYNSMYQKYLKVGGTPLHGFTEENLNKVLGKLNESNSTGKVTDDVLDYFQDIIDSGGEVYFDSDFNDLKNPGIEINLNCDLEKVDSFYSKNELDFIHDLLLIYNDIRSDFFGKKWNDNSSKMEVIKNMENISPYTKNLFQRLEDLISSRFIRIILNDFNKNAQFILIFSNKK